MSKILIEIPDNVDYRNYDMPYFVLDAITSGKLIPDNATNGDIIKAMFPNLKTTICVTAHIPYVSVMGENYEFNLTFPLKWWNKSYKAERKDKK